MIENGAPEPRALRIPGHDGVQLSVWDYAGEGRPLVLCHCTGGVARMWDPVVARLGMPFHVYAVDARGHGDSDQPVLRDEYRWEQSGRDLLAVLDALGLGKDVWAVGHSGGAAHIAYAEMLRPGAFSRVVLIEAIVGPREFFAGESPLAAVARRRRNRFASREEARARFATKPPMSRWHTEALDAYIAHGLRDAADGGVELKLPGTIEAFVYELGGACDVYERLHELRFEAMLVAGADSYGMTLMSAQNARLPRAECRVLADTEHFAPQEQPNEVAALITEWFGRQG